MEANISSVRVGWRCCYGVKRHADGNQLEVDLVKIYVPCVACLRLTAKSCQLSSDNMAVTMDVRLYLLGV